MTLDDSRRELMEQLKSQIRELRAKSVELKDASEKLRDECNSKIAAEKKQLAGQWEYFVEDDIGVERLDQIGGNGWELVSAASFTTGFGLGGNSSMTVHIRYVFKKPIIQRYSDALNKLIDRLNATLDSKTDIDEQLERLGVELGQA